MNNENGSENKSNSRPLYMSIGLSIGVGIGAAMDNIPIGMCIGLASAYVSVRSWISGISKKPKRIPGKRRRKRTDLVGRITIDAGTHYGCRRLWLIKCYKQLTQRRF